MIDQLIEEVVQLRTRVAELEDARQALQSRVATMDRTASFYIEHIEAVPLPMPLPFQPRNRIEESIWSLAGMALSHATKIKLDRKMWGYDPAYTETFSNARSLDNQRFATAMHKK